jgi:hypothetical protein
MSKRMISYGKCFLCGQSFAKNAITRHLRTCSVKQEAIAKEVQTQQGKPVRLFHLQAEGRYVSEYWLHFEMPASATLADLDDFLRAIWLECCGHLSAFTVGNTRYEKHTDMVDAMWKEFFSPFVPTRSMSIKLGNVLQVGEEFMHEYDFGTTTELKLKVVAEREGTRPKGGVRLLARNYAPDYRCAKCQQPAQWIYTFEYPLQLYCETHARKHEAWEEGFLPLVNSPRTGECGYTGPEDEALKFEERRPISAG